MILGFVRVLVNNWVVWIIFFFFGWVIVCCLEMICFFCIICGISSGCVVLGLLGILMVLDWCCGFELFIIFVILVMFFIRGLLFLSFKLFECFIIIIGFVVFLVWIFFFILCFGFVIGFLFWYIIEVLIWVFDRDFGLFLYVVIEFFVVVVFVFGDLFLL